MPVPKEFRKEFCTVNNRSCFADKKNQQSIAIANEWFKPFKNIPKSRRGKNGTSFEDATRKFLERKLRPSGQLRVLDSGVTADRLVKFANFEHLAPFNSNPGGTMYTIPKQWPSPDVGVTLDWSEVTLLHAAVECKRTLRSDRAANAMTGALFLQQTCSGRAPHFAVVTAEPLPTRLASTCQSAGFVDHCFHIDLKGLTRAVHKVGTQNQRETLDDLIDRRRLLDIEELPKILQ